LDSASVSLTVLATERRSDGAAVRERPGAGLIVAMVSNAEVEAGGH